MAHHGQGIQQPIEAGELAIREIQCSDPPARRLHERRFDISGIAPALLHAGT